jgi:hypothetical protein
MAITRSTDPWEQRILEGEPDICYSMFRGWLLSPPEARTAPPDLALAQMFHWAERALAYDQTRDIPDDPKERVAHMFREATKLACIELKKHIKVAQEDPNPTMAIQQLLRLLPTSVGLPAAAQGMAPAVNVYEISDDYPQEDLDRMIKMLAGAVRNA